MYIPEINREDNTATLVTFMQKHNFVTLVSTLNGELIASHIPVMVEKQSETVRVTGHLARANSHCKAFDENQSLMIFAEPHAYISPLHYEKFESVPTWNYVAVHAYGVLEAVTFKDQPHVLENMLKELMQRHEASYKKRWDSLSEKFKRGMMQGIVGFEMKVTKLEGKYKLSQNKSLEEQKEITRALLASSDSAEAETGRIMQERLELSGS